MPSYLSKKPNLSGIQATCSTACSFFFQAKDGIRDGRVTGVQTCALPIWTHDLYWVVVDPARQGHGVGTRSEERRVGKSVDVGGCRIRKRKKSLTECPIVQRSTPNCVLDNRR